MFPRICLPLVVCGITGTTSALLTVATLAVFVLTLMLGLGVGLLLGIVNVFVRDVGQIVPIALQFLFWFTPIVYLSSALPEGAQSVLALNPLQVLVTALHDTLVFDRAPDWQALLIVGGVSAILLAAALVLFRRASAEMVDVL